MHKPVSLIISFYNKIDFLRLIFAALEQQSYRDFEVIIADDGSRQDIVHEVKRLIVESTFQVKHVWHEDKGWRKNIILNKAIVASEADYLVFIDGDCIPHPLFLEEHFDSRKPNQVVCGRRVTLTEKTSKYVTSLQIQNRNLHKILFWPLLFESFFSGEKTHIVHIFRIKNIILRSLLAREKIKGILGCNFSAWKEDLMKVNGFDERFVHPGMGEDTDLDNRLRHNGVLTISKKFSITIYHMFHPQLDLSNRHNFVLRDENIENKVSFTPYGIDKTNMN
ncbi:MAG: glycosyltransferase [Paludibacter sp.]|nr:glycosyltransferase [Paludibacter sp.]